MSRKITYIISSVDKALEFEWVIQFLDPERFQLSFIILNPKPSSALAELAQARGIPVKFIIYRSQASFPRALLQTFWQLLRWRPDLVNCHLPQGTLIGLLAAKLVGIKHRYYTRHHSTLNHQYHPHAIKYDKWSNQLATHIIAVSQVVKEVLVNKEGVSPAKISVVNHCLDLEQFENVEEARIKAVKERNLIPEAKPVIGVIARYTFWKGIQDIIPAFKKIRRRHPDAHLILANARKGDYLKEIDQLLSELPDGSYTEIPFEKDLYALYQVFDLFIHTPVDGQSEAFGQIYLEALASRVPSVFTKSGIAVEIMKNEQNALIVPFQDSESIAHSALKLLEDQQLCDRLVETGEKTVRAGFTIDKKMAALEQLYQKT